MQVALNGVFLLERGGSDETAAAALSSSWRFGRATPGDSASMSERPRKERSAQQHMAPRRRRLRQACGGWETDAPGAARKHRSSFEARQSGSSDDHLSCSPQPSSSNFKHGEQRRSPVAHSGDDQEASLDRQGGAPPDRRRTQAGPGCRPALALRVRWSCRNGGDDPRFPVPDVWVSRCCPSSPCALLIDSFLDRLPLDLSLVSMKV